MVYESRDSSGVNAINSYLLKLLEENLGWNRKSYKRLNPISPLGQQPELMQTTKPFITYGSSGQPGGHLYQLRSESLALNIYAKDSTDVDDIIDVITTALERGDESADDINWYLAREKNASGNLRNRKVAFTSVEVAMSERAAPDEEGGFNSGMVLLTIRYVRTGNPVKTRDFVL